jgi:ABC-type multidrug transport system ATPase subunit
MISLDDVTIVTSSGMNVLHQLTLLVAPGEVHALSTASPPSAVFDAILGFLPPESGAIAIGGHDSVAHPHAVRRLTAVVRTEAGLEPRLSVRANVAFLLRLAGSAVPSARVIDAALRQAEIPDRRFDRLAAELRDQERLAVSLAVARLRATPAVLVDNQEVDWFGPEAEHFAALVRELAATGPAVLVATGNPDFARAVADRVWVLEWGNIVLDWSRAGHRVMTTPLEFEHGHGP